MRQALWSGLLVTLTTAPVGTWLVLRGMSFFSDALAHGVLPGIAVAFIIGGNTTFGALVAAAIMIAGINLVRHFSPLPEDSSIGLLFVGFLALAVVIMSSSSGSYSGDLTRFLFGSITGVTDSDLLRQIIIAAFTLCAVIVLHRAILLTTFSEVHARLLGFRPQLVHAALLGLLALAIVASFQAVGNLLVFAFLIAPPSAATLLAKRVSTIMVTAVGLGALSVIAGLLISYHHDTAASATMALGAVALFFVALILSRLTKTTYTHLVS